MTLFQEFFSTELLVFSIPLCFSLLIWMISILGLINFEAFDVEVDLDTDVSIEADMDVDVDADSDIDVEGGSFLGKTLTFLGVGKVPLSLLLTMFFFFFGSIGISLKLFTGEWMTSAMAGLLSFPIGITLTSLLSRPLSPFFKDHGETESAASFTGKVAVLKSGRMDKSFGQAVIKTNGVPLDVSVRSYENDLELNAGDSVLLIEYDTEKGVYYAEPYIEE